MTDLELVRDMIRRLDRNAEVVSNMQQPRRDNSYGRAAQALEEALDYLEVLPDVTH